MSPEEFFMYLIIALIVVAPLSARLYHYLTANRAKRMLQEQLQNPGQRAATPTQGDSRG
jgi:uncharacterized protein involved in outer membrane biogenesis